MSDKRSKTSRRNLGDHVPEALSPEGTTAVAVRLPNELVRRLDDEREDTSRSAFIRDVLTQYMSTRGALRVVAHLVAQQGGEATLTDADLTTPYRLDVEDDPLTHDIRIRAKRRSQEDDD